MIMQSEHFATDCAETTIYRTLMLFSKIDLARQTNRVMAPLSNFFAHSLGLTCFPYLTGRRAPVTGCR